MKFLEKNPFIMIVVGVIGISLSSIFVKWSEAPSAVTAASRLLWTVILMTPIVLGRSSVRKELGKSSKKTVLLSVLSGLFLAIHFVVWFESLQHTSVASSTVIVCTEVIWVSLGYCLFLKGKISVKAVVAILITLIGSVLIAYADSGSGSHLYGDVLALVAAMAVAVYMLLGRVVRETTSTTVYTYMVYMACAAILILVCIVRGEGVFEFGWSPILMGFLLAVFSTILGHSIFSWCLKYFSPSFVSASKLCEPVVAALLASVLFVEIPTWTQVIGGALILMGVFYYSRIEKENK